MRLTPRKITDARTLQALAHPVRIALMEELALGGAMTATEVGERKAAGDSTFLFYLTPEELEQLNAEVTDVLRRWEALEGRREDPARRPPGSAPVETPVLSHPIAPPQPADESDPSAP